MSETRLLLDTYCTITINGTDDTALLNEAFEICVQMETLLSMTMEGSDVWRINHAQGKPVTVKQETLEVILQGIEFGRLSDGMFDITIGRLSRLWNFGGGEPAVPDMVAIEDARKTVDYRQITIGENTEGLSDVTLADSAAWMDLGAIAKGYIADKIAEFLAANGAGSALIDLGGDIVAVGSRQDGNPWRLGVREPFGGSNDLIGVIEVTGAAVVSSGTYERQFTEDGVFYHHILDPNTGMPAQSDVIGATIVSDSAITGEGLSTIAVLTGSKRIQTIFEQTPGFIGAVIVLDSFEILTFGEIEFQT